MRTTANQCASRETGDFGQGQGFGRLGHIVFLYQVLAIEGVVMEHGPGSMHTLKDSRFRGNYDGNLSAQFLERFFGAAEDEAGIGAGANQVVTLAHIVLY